MLDNLDTQALAETAIYLELRERGMDMPSARRAAIHLRRCGITARTVMWGLDHEGPERDAIEKVLRDQSVAIP